MGQSFMSEPSKVAIVFIGRNEEQHLYNALQSAISLGHPIVYVDSGSTDRSLEIAVTFDIEIVHLEKPYSVSRARNAGIRYLQEFHPSVEFIQLVDADCTLYSGWIALAHEYLVHHPQTALVRGQRHEVDPDISWLHILLGIEWELSLHGDEAAGGDMLLRSQAFTAVGGFAEYLPSGGEDLELGFRLKQLGWQMVALRADMTSHHGHLKSWRDWWRRSIRSGYAYANVADIYKRTPQKYWLRPTLSNFVWGCLLPLMALIFAPLTQGKSILLAATLYLVLWIRVYYSIRRLGYRMKQAIIYASTTVFGKLPMSFGLVLYLRDKIQQHDHHLIEYKQK
jgi:glycosyltransferase involved in cell wall biosynthesis